MTSKPVLVLLAMLSLTAPAAEACHASLNVTRIIQGFLVDEDGVHAATMTVPECAGPADVTLRRATPEGWVAQTIAVVMDIPVPGMTCLFEGGCGDGYPIVPFTIQGGDLDIAGALTNSAHHTYTYSLVGSYAGAAAVFIWILA